MDELGFSVSAPRTGGMCLGEAVSFSAAWTADNWAPGILESAIEKHVRIPVETGSLQKQGFVLWAWRGETHVKTRVCDVGMARPTVKTRGFAVPSNSTQTCGTVH